MEAALICGKSEGALRQLAMKGSIHARKVQMDSGRGPRDRWQVHRSALEGLRGRSPQVDAPQGYVSLTEAAHRLGVSQSRALQLVQRELLRGHKVDHMGRKAWVVMAADVEARANGEPEQDWVSVGVAARMLRTTHDYVRGAVAMGRLEGESEGDDVARVRLASVKRMLADLDDRSEATRDIGVAWDGLRRRQRAQAMTGPSFSVTGLSARWEWKVEAVREVIEAGWLRPRLGDAAVPADEVFELERVGVLKWLAQRLAAGEPLVPERAKGEVA